MKKFKIKGFIKSDIPLNVSNLEKQINTIVGSSYYGDLELENIEIYNDYSFFGDVFLMEDFNYEDFNMTNTELCNSIIEENICDSFFMIDRFETFLK